MEITDCESACVKKVKLGKDELSMEIEEPLVVEELDQADNFKSPITDPVLTPEIWDQILGGLSGNDFLSVINAVPDWNHLLDSRKTTELFPMFLPHVLPYLKSNEMLACRGVQWDSKAAVDKILEAHELSDDVFSSRYSTSFCRKLDRIGDKYAQDIDELSEVLALKTKDPSYNPFLTRTLFESVNFPDDRVAAAAEADHHINLTEFLSRYGAHLWVFYFTFFDRVDSIGVGKLSSYLSHLPNLKTLTLYDSGPDGDLCRNCELPPLNHLSYLDLSCFIAHSVISQLIRTYGAQLTTLAVTGSWIKNSMIETSDFQGLLPKLKRLCVTDVDEAVLGKLSVVHWPLEALELQLKPSISGRRELLLMTISNFKESLRHLELYLSSYFDLQKESVWVLKTETSISNEEKEEDEEAMSFVRSVFKQSAKMEKLLVYWKSTTNDIHRIKMVKTQSDDSVEEKQYKLKIITPWFLSS